jgi:phospholipid/cholesterol/gamma-HCH transport system substrate-binding protein
MSTKVSPTLIGAFVIGAVALIVIAILLLGSGRLFRQTRDFVLYFDNSVNGLRVGAPVKFKGVEVGSVKDIRLQLEKGAEVNKIPVIIEIDLEKLTLRGATPEIAVDREAFHKAVVEGFRGQLAMESLVTGVLYVALDFFPGTPINFVQQENVNNKYPEIPTLPTSLELAKGAVERILNKLEEVDFKGLIDSLTKTSDGVGQLVKVNSPTVKSILQSVDQAIPQLRGAILDFQTLTATANNNVTNVSADLHQTLTAAHSAIEQIAATMKEAETTIISVRTTIDPNSPTFYELTKSLREVSGAASSIRLLADSLDRNPQAVILGKPETPERK